ncbi:MAG: T9SS type A sorting domain-containing protein [Bacteroidia bacterium]
MRKYTSITTLFLVFFSFPLYSQWNTNITQNTPICVATAKQVDPRLASDGKGGAYIAWKDFRNGASNPDIFIQRIDKNGNVMWTLDGVPLCTQSADQSTPAIMLDPQNGAIVAWSDWRSGIERDLYAQKIDSNGVVQWTLDGAIVSDKPIREHNEKVASDEKGGVFVLWEQQSGGWDVWIQRLDGGGQRKFGNGGKAICSVSSNKINGKLQKDNRNGVFAVWQDLRNGSDYDVYAQRVSYNSIFYWNSAGVPICTASGTQANVKIDPDTIADGIYITWVDDRNGNNDIYAQRLDSLGNVMWGTNGVPVCAAMGSQSAPDIVSNASVGGGVIVTWKDTRNGNTDIYVQKILPNGTPEWTLDGVPVCTTTAAQLNPNIVSDKKGGAIITWQDSINNNWDIRTQRIDGNGLPAWTIDGIDVSLATGAQTGPKHVSDDMGGAIYVWEDARTGTRDLYAHHIEDTTSTLSLIHANTPIALSYYPNPFHNQLQVHYTLTKPSLITLSLYNALGQMVWQSQSLQNEGSQQQEIKVKNLSLAAGIYVLQVKSDTFVANYKVMKID